VFSVQRPVEVENKTLLLVDDVMTTGSTVNECAGMLQNAGAKSIHVLALAWTV
jgi:predicted amidophosphoribosyltransferase